MEPWESDDFDEDAVEAHMFVHILFSTAGQRDVLPEDELPRLYEAITESLAEIDARTVCLGGTTNHIHILTQFSPDWPLQAVIDKSKDGSAEWIRKNIARLRDFAWQESLGAFMISPEEIGQAESFIRDQASHHEVVSFKDEFAAILRENGMEFDEDEILE